MTHPHLKQLSPLTRTQLALMAVGYEALYIEPYEIDGVNFEQLVVVLHTDENHYEHTISLYFINDVMDLIRVEYKIPPSPNKAYTVQMVMKFPFEIQEEQWGELACLTLELNRLIELGAFGVHQKDGLYFRYSLVQDSKDIDMKVLAEVLEIIASNLKGCLVFFNQYFNGTRTLDEIYDLINDAEQQADKGNK